MAAGGLVGYLFGSDQQFARPPAALSNQPLGASYAGMCRLSKCHSKQNRLSEVEIRIGAATLTYEQLFKGIYNQDARTLEHAQHIYWGKAWAKRLANGTGYRIEFNEKMKTEGAPRRPSLLVLDDMIEKYPLKKLLAERLKTAIEKDKGGCILFVYGAPIIVPDLDSATESEPYTRFFINFRVPSPDMLDIQKLSLFEQLKRDQ